jgi:hypothetical protein
MEFVSTVRRLYGRAWLITSLVAVRRARRPARAGGNIPAARDRESGVHVFSVEMATTEEEKTTGLMYRKAARR